jgi:single-stranded-DNA-specific exonuclease
MYARRALKPEDFEPTIEVDGELCFEQINKDLVRAVEALEPFGIGNPRPMFATRAARVLQPVRVMKDKHAKLRLRDSDSTRPYNAIGWRMREQIEALALTIGDKVDVVYTLDENTDPEFGGLQLLLKDVAKSSAAAIAS